MSHQYWVWVFGDIAGLRWVLERNTMAFRAALASRVKKHQPNDRVVLYTARGAYRNPTRDRARLAGLVRITDEPRRGRKVIIADRDFHWFIPFTSEKILPERQGPEVTEFVNRLAVVKRPDVWGHYFRGSPVQISGKDFDVLARAIRGFKQRRPR